MRVYNRNCVVAMEQVNFIPDRSGFDLSITEVLFLLRLGMKRSEGPLAQIPRELLHILAYHFRTAQNKHLAAGGLLTPEKASSSEDISRPPVIKRHNRVRSNDTVVNTGVNRELFQQVPATEAPAPEGPSQ